MRGDEVLGRRTLSGVEVTLRDGDGKVLQRSWTDADGIARVGSTAEPTVIEAATRPRSYAFLPAL